VSQRYVTILDMISRRRLRRLFASALAFVAILGVALRTASRWLVPRIAARIGGGETSTECSD
jgi:hypothetical protein